MFSTGYDLMVRVHKLGLYLSPISVNSLHCVSPYCRKLAGCTLFITGASRGIGKAIALRAAQDGANIVIAAKTSEPHPKLPGTIYTAAEEGRWVTKLMCTAVPVG